MPATLEDFMKMEGVDPSVKADAIKAWQEDTDSVIASKYGKDSEEYKAGSYHLANDVNSALQKLQVPTLQPESPLKTAGRAFASKIFPAIGTALGAYGGEELAGLAGIESGPGALATSVLGGVAGGALGGMGAQKLQNLALGDDAAENERQMRVNAEASPFASQLGGIIPTILSLGGSGGILKATEAAAGRRAATEGIEQVAKALPSKLTSVVDSAIAGARLGASDTAQQWVNGEDVDGSKLADNMARNAVQFGPLGLLGHAETILKSVMQAPSQAAITTLAGALYDNVAHGKPINPTELAKQTGAEAPGFAMFNAVASTLARHPIYKAAAPAIKSPEIAAKEERITQAADQASLAGLHETAAALDQTKTKLEQPVQEAVPITEESKPETPASEPVVQPAVEEPIIDSTAINTKPIVEQPTPKENAPIQDTIQEVVPEERESGNQSREAAETSGSDSLLRPEESAGSTADIPRDDGIPREESQEVQVNEPIPAEIAPDRVEPTPENAEEAKAEASVEPRNEAQRSGEGAVGGGAVETPFQPAPEGIPSTSELAKKASAVAKGEEKADVGEAVKKVIPKQEEPSGPSVEEIPKRHEAMMQAREEEAAFARSNHVREALKEEFSGNKAWTPEKIEEAIKYYRGEEKTDLTEVQKRALSRVKDKILGTLPTEELSAKGFTGTKEAVDKARENYRFFETILAANPDKIKGAEARIKKAEADIKKETDPEKLHDLKVEEKNARQELEQLRNEKKELPAKLEEARKRFNSETELHSRIEANTPKLKFSNAEIPEGDKINDNARRDAVRRLNSSLTGRKIVKGVIFSPDWQRVLSHPELKDRSFTPDDMRAMKSAEGFHDPVSGKTVVITDNVRQKPGETPAQAVFRVIVHERVGHEGAEWMKDNDPAFRKAWHEAVKNIPQEELDALKKRYPGLDSDRLIGEWFAQKAGDLDPNEVPDPKTAFGKIWQAIKDFISRTFGYSSKLDQQVRDLVGVIARHEMALDGRERNGGVEFSLPTKEEAREAVVKAKGLKEFTPVRKVIGEFNAKMQATDIRLKDFQKEFNKELKRTLDKDQQARLTKRAMGAYIQSDGDVATLKKWADGSKGAEKAKYEAAQNLNPEQKTLAKQIMDRYEELHEKAVKSGIMSENAWKENYLTQLWERPATRKGQQDFANFTGKLSKSFKFGKQRTFENYFEGEQAGFKAKTDDPSELLAIYESALEKTIATRQLAKDLTEQKASDGNPLAVPVGAPVSTDPTQLAAAGKAPADDLTLINASSVPKGENDVNYQRINNPALSKWKWIDTTENGHTVLMNGELAVHPEAYTHIKNMLGRSAIKEWYESPSQTLGGVVGKNLVRLTDVLNSQIKGSMLSLSPFHIVQEGTHAVGHGVSPFSFEKIDPDNPAHADAMRHGLMLGGDNSGMNQWMEGVKGGGWMTKIPGLGKTMDAINDFTFHEYIPGLKLKTYDAALKRNMERYKPEIEAGKVKEADVKALTAEQINNAYGHLNYRDMGANPTIQHLLRLSFLAPDFLLARAGFTKEAIKGIADKSGREQLKAMAVLATTFFISSRILNALANDGDMKTKEAPFGVVVGGREYTMRSVPEDIYKALTEPRKFASGRLSPLTTRPAMDLLTGRNYRGESISSGQVAKDTLLQAVPLSARSLPWLRDLTESSKNNPISPWEQFIGSLGLHVNRYSPITEVHKLANKFAEGKGKPAGSYPTSAYTPLKNKLADANMQEARVEFQKLYDAAKAKEPKLTRQQINQKLTKSVRESLSHYFTGERALDEEFKKSLKPEEKALYKAAMGEREKIWKRYQKFTSQHLGDLRVS